MSIQRELFTNLNYDYGKVTYSENGNIFTYTIDFDYTAAPSVLKIEYDSDKATISLVMSYIDSFIALAKNDLKKSYQILMYLDVFYSEPDVCTDEGNIIISNSYTFEPGDFNYTQFSQHLTTIEKMTHEINHMLSTKDFDTDLYQDTIYGGGMFNLMTWESSD